MDDPSRSSTDEDRERRRRRVRLWENLFQLAATSLAIVLGAWWAQRDPRIVLPVGKAAAMLFGGGCGLITGLFVSGLVLKVLQIRRGES